MSVAAGSLQAATPRRIRAALFAMRSTSLLLTVAPGGFERQTKLFRAAHVIRKTFC